MNSLSNGKIVTEKVNLAWLAELAISKARIEREEIDYVRYPAGMRLLLPALKRGRTFLDTQTAADLHVSCVL